MHASRSVGQTQTHIHRLAGEFVTQSGAVLPEVDLAYELYGEINERGDNVILVFHALTGSQHAAGQCDAVPEVGERWTEEIWTGWWDGYVGPGRGIDTDRYAVLCVNYLGGCYGSTGPASIDPSTGSPYGGSFPTLTLT
ncbi:MAG TPA: homoserine O-acetyltransferase, partial [Acidimicrobiia bacterium]